MRNLCALFDMDTVRCPRGIVEMGFADMNASARKYAFQETIVAAKTGVFHRQGKPLATWWYPSDLLPEVSGDEPWQDQTVNIHIWSPDGRIESPVVIDPLTGEVFEPEFHTTSFAPGVGTEQIILHNVPLRNTPLFATDRSVIDLQ
jgi:hypothetical protein